MNKGFKRIATLLVSVATVATMSLSAFACTNNTVNVSGKEVGYGKSPVIKQSALTHEWDDKCDTFYLNKIVYKDIKASQQTVGNTLLTVNLNNKNAYHNFRDYYRSLRFVDANGNQLCGSKNPIVAQRTGYEKVTVSVMDNALFNSFTEFVKETRYINGLTKENKCKFTFNINQFHVLNGFEVKFVNEKDNKIVYNGYVDNLSHYGDDLFDDEEYVFTTFDACIDYNSNNIKKGNYYIVINGVKVKKVYFG